MAIKQTKTSNQKNSVNILNARIEALITEGFFKDLPGATKQKMVALKEELKSYNPFTDTSKYNEIIGNTMDSKSILDVITQATGYNKWELDEIAELEQEELEDIKNDYGIAFSEQTIFEYFFTRPTNNRNDVNHISVVALPGYHHVGIQTGRSGYYLDDLVTIDELKTALSKEL